MLFLNELSSFLTKCLQFLTDDKNDGTPLVCC